MSEKTAVEIYEFLQHCNWNNGLEEMMPLLNEPNFEFGHALLCYWLLQGPFYYLQRYKDHTYGSLLLELEDKSLSGFYSKGSIHYHPITEEDLSRTIVFQLKKDGLPTELIEPVYAQV
jgi:hypothetical protein